MVGFSKTLAVETYPPWKDEYIPYDLLKRLIELCSKNSTAPHDLVANLQNIYQAISLSLRSSDRHVERTLGALREEFSEMRKAHAIHLTIDAESRPEELEDTPETPAIEIQGEREAPEMTLVQRRSRKKKPLWKKMIGLFSRSDSSTERQSREDFAEVVEVYRKLVFLKRLCVLNVEGARKILVKLDVAVTVQRPKGTGDEVSMDTIRSLLRQCKEVVDASNLPKKALEVDEQIAAVSVYAGNAFPGRDLHSTGFEDRESSYKWTAKWHFIFLALIIFVVLHLSPIFPEHPEAHHGLAAFVCVCILWITEASPYFATALAIPLLTVPFGVFPNHTKVMSARKILGSTFTPVQMLVLGGIAIGRALQKLQLERGLVVFVLKNTAHRPYLLLLLLLAASATLSAVVSNVAAPVLLLGVINPVLQELPRETGAPQAILLALAMASNFGGMITPMASPQNAVALFALLSFGKTIDFGRWLLCAFPIVAVGVFLSWAVVCLWWRPFRHIQKIPLPPTTHDTTDREAQSLEDVHKDRRAHRINVGIVLVTAFATIVLWCVPSSLTFGDAGIVGLIPLVVYFGLGILTKNDFNSLPWHLIFLLAGGNMLAVVMRECDLINLFVEELHPFLLTHTKYQVLALLLAAVVIVTTFISHTVATIMLAPFVLQLAFFNPELPSIEVVIFLLVTCASGSMTFPITSLPNLNSLIAEDAHGQPYLVMKNFFFPGSILTVFSYAFVMGVMIPMSESLLGGTGKGLPIPPGGWNITNITNITNFTTSAP